MLPAPTMIFFREMGWGAGLAVLLLQLATVALPAGETRDWLYYYMVAGAAVMFVAGNLYAPKRYESLITRGKTLLAAYAALTLSAYFLLPLVQPWLLWLWVLAALVGYAWSRRACEAAGAAWLVLLAFSMCGSLIYKSPWYALAGDINAVQYAVSFIVFLIFTCPFIYHALRQPYQKSYAPIRLRKEYIAVLHVLVVYVLALVQFRTDRLDTRFAVHHWKAYLEPATSMRDGGWLLWDVPNVYGFLQTLLMAVMPTATTWQSLYILNGVLLVAASYAIFYMLFARFRSVGGFVFAALMALACAVLVLPTTGDPRMFPSTGALRFFWVYPVVGYVYWLCRRFRDSGKLPEKSCLAGNVFWLLGVLWSLESALFVTLIWAPSLALIKTAETFSDSLRPTFTQIACKAGGALVAMVSLLLSVVACIALVYRAALSHWPDWSLVTAYAKAFAFSYATLPIEHFAALPCWLFVFFLMAAACARYASQARIGTHTLLNLTVFYAAMVALWAICSYYIPFSEDLHLTGTLPLLVYLSALVALHISSVDMDVDAKTLYERGVMCFCSVVLLGTLSHMTPGVYTAVSFPFPVHADVTATLTPPPAKLQAVLDKAHIPVGAHVQVLSQPMVYEGKDHVLEFVEGIYVKGAWMKPWLLPNTILGYDAPLSPELYQSLAQRRLERMDNNEGWVIEKKDNPLEHYPWLKSVIESGFRQKAAFENSTYRIRRYERIPSAH